MSSGPLLESGFERLKKFSDLENVEDAAQALSILVTMYMAEPGPPLDPRYKTVPESLELLKREPELHAMLKHAHAEESYELVRASVLIRKPRKPFSKEAQEFLDEIRPALATFISDPKSIARWKFNAKLTDPALLAHMESLDIMGLGATPWVITKDLGTFMDDPVLAARVENLFVRGKKTVLVNTSGSGKTRLTLEGLCHNWGFYFTILNLAVMDLGSRDISGVVQDLNDSSSGFVENVDPSAHSTGILEHNHQLAEQAIGQTILSRLLIFRMFLDITKEGGPVVAHDKMKWLILQIQPNLPTFGDIFQELIDRLVDYDTQDFSDALDGIREHLGSDFHLFFVLDEGQEAAKRFPQAFHLDPGKHPFLVKILDTWNKHIPQELFSCVIAGTDIPMQIFEGSEYAEQVRWTSDTGSFDDQEFHERYLRRFLPSSLLDAELWREFLQRAWAWTRGRHRYTASLVMFLLMSNFQQPNNVLDHYMTTAIRFRPSDGAKWAEIERGTHQEVPYGRLPTMLTHAFPWLYRDYARKTRSTLQDIIYHYLAADRPLPLLADMTQAVSLGFGRFMDGQMKEVACDEPIALIGTAAWMTRKPPADEGLVESGVDYNYLTALEISPPPTAKAYAACLAFYFSRAFDSKHKLSDILKFPEPVPAWAKRPATLVELHTDDGKVQSSVIPDTGIVAPLAMSATSLEEAVSWMEHATRTPFCIPQAEAFDLLFVLKLGNGAYIWVIMRVDPTTSDGGDLLKSLEETNLFCDAESDVDSTLHKRAVELLNTSPLQTSTSKSNAPTVLRVVAAFKNQIDLEDHPEKGSPPHASLALDKFHELTAAQPLSLFVETVAANLLKRKHEALDDESERQSSVPIEEERKVTKKAKGTKKAAKSEASRAPKSKTKPTSEPSAATSSHYNLRTRGSPVPPTSTHNLRERPPKDTSSGEEKKTKRGPKSK
ncbi:hypothetical protein MSAN_01577900 [Mycena sanguinolenta]|uniref:Uncharacterized protein n=1 Tax=Mycena sanguinolenta TaxID=230812 RepID=A0A8H6Y1D3_9AGAR|nr:hypothetical protein MSAN_01577900 [Mycena sanguinolenta]